MTEFASEIPLPHVPDDLTVPQFIFDATRVPRPKRPSTTPFFIEESTGLSVFESEVKQRTYDLANALRLKWDIKNDDVVCLLSPNDVDFAVVVWAVHVLGGIITPGNPNCTPEELQHQLTITKAALLIVHPVCFKVALAAAKKRGLPESRIVLLKDSPSEISKGSCLTVQSLISLGSQSERCFEERTFKSGEAKKAIALLCPSSGTTGKSKAVALSHYAVVANVIQTAAHYRLNDPSWPNKYMNPGDTAIGVLPFFHVYGFVVTVHYSLFCGMSVVVIPKFNFNTFLESIVRYRVTNLYLVPPHVVLLCKQAGADKFDFSHVKFCLSAAAPLSGELSEKLRKVLPNAAIGQGYGLTETCGTVSLISAEERDGSGAGKLVPGTLARVIKPDGTLAGEGEQGELYISSPSLALGYFGNAKATRETFLSGWIRTGDEVFIKNNAIFVLDRIKEIMKVRGFQVAPAELEGHLLLHPDIADVCVLGIKDDYSGELPFAYVVLQPHAALKMKDSVQAEQQLKKSIFKHVANAKIHYKWLTGGIEFLDAIPKNPSGKILRRVLRERIRPLPRPVEAKL